MGTMKALVKCSDVQGDIRLIDTEEPACLENQVKIEVKACGICATDLHIAAGEYPWEQGRILGHEFSGVIVEAGHGVKKFKVGDRVASCMDGGFAEYAVKAENDWVFRIPSHIGYEEAALIEPMCAAAQGVLYKTPVRPGDVVLIEGAGIIGISALLFVKLMGGTALVAGRKSSKKRLEIAKELGADYIVDVESDNPEEFIERITEGRGADFCIECAGSESSLNLGLKLLKYGGQLTQLGIFSKPPTVDLTSLVYNDRSIVGSIGYTKEVWRRCIGLMSEGKISAKGFASVILPLAEWERGFELTREKEGFRVLLAP